MNYKFGTVELNIKSFFIFFIPALMLIADLNTCQAQGVLSNDKNNKKNLEISLPQTIAVASVCPGCPKIFSTESYCLEWVVTTNQSDQNFQVFFSNPSNSASLNLDWVWTYQDDLSGEWKQFNNCKNPTSCSGHINNIFNIKGSSSDCHDGNNMVRFRVCVTGLQIPSTQGTCNLDCGFTVTVSCYDSYDEDHHSSKGS